MAFDDQPRSSGSLWADMFGLGPFVRMLSDPSMMQNAALMMQAIAEGAKANIRMEMKLDFIIRSMGYDPATVTPADYSAPGRFGPPLLSAGHGPAGTGAYTVTGGAADNGTGTAPPTAETNPQAAE